MTAYMGRNQCKYRIQHHGPTLLNKITLPANIGAGERSPLQVGVVEVWRLFFSLAFYYPLARIGGSDYITFFIIKGFIQIIMEL